MLGMMSHLTPAKVRRVRKKVRPGMGLPDILGELVMVFCEFKSTLAG